MKKIVPFAKISFVFLALVLFLLPNFVRTAFAVVDPDPGTAAAAPTEIPDLNQSLGDEKPSFTLDPTADKLTDADPFVTVTFNNLPSGEKIFFCTGSPFCFRGLNSKEDIGTNPVPNFLFPEKYRIDVGPSSADGSVKFKICALGKYATICGHKVYFSGFDLPVNEGNSAFGAGKVITFSVGTQPNNNYIPQALGFFYVPYAYPQAEISPKTNLTTQNTLTISLKPETTKGTNALKNQYLDSDTSWKRNNYQITMRGGTGYYGGGCVGWVGPSQNSPLTVNFPGLSKGTYTVYIRAQTNEDDLLSVIWKRQTATAINVNSSRQEGINFVSNEDALNGCEGGFTYYKASCRITADPPGGSCSDFKKDPKGDEYRQFLEALNILNKLAPNYILPCGKGEDSGPEAQKTRDKFGNCLSVDTAIGPISVQSPQAFILYVFRLALMIAGFGGVVLILISGYIMMISAGDKEKVQGAREMITSAIVGLLFIILSIVILEVIGVDILKLPGFGK